MLSARDEAHNIAKLLKSINQQDTKPHEVIVVNDSSTDDTAGVAAGHGARVIDAQALPDGWMGKPWACYQGAEAATGDWFLFLDADTELHSDAMSVFQQLSESTDSVHSVCPYHQVKSPYEQLSAFFNTMMLAGSNAFSPR